MSDGLFDFIFGGPGLFLLCAFFGVRFMEIRVRKKTERLQAARDTARAQLDASRAPLRYVATCSRCDFRGSGATSRQEAELAGDIEAEHFIRTYCRGSISLTPETRTVQASTETREMIATLTAKWPLGSFSAGILPNGMTVEQAEDRAERFSRGRNPYILRQPPPLS